MAAAIHDFEVEQGSDLLKPFIWKDSTGTPVDLSNYTAKLQVRKSPSSTEILFEMSTENGRISIIPSAGKVILIFKSADTSALNWKQGQYDLELTSVANTRKRLIKGAITLSPEITR